MEIRDATADDYDAYARLLPELRVDDPVPSRERFASELAERVLVATDGGAVVGYGLIETMADVGYVRNIVSDPARRRGGIGAALMEAMRQRFVDAGARTWCLNVKPDNAPAVALYQRSGLAVAYHSCVLRVASGVALPPADGLGFSEVAPDDDAVVEDTFALLRGQLASARSKTGRNLVQIHRDGALAGIAVFAAALPGAFPFRMRDPSVGAPAIAHLRTLAPPDARYIQVVVEDDPALREALLAAGAVLRVEMLHMRGPLQP